MNVYSPQPVPLPVRLRQPLSPLRLESITEGHEDNDSHANGQDHYSPGSTLSVPENLHRTSGRQTLHRSNLSPKPILKRRKSQEEVDEDREREQGHREEGDTSRYDISVIAYRTSCCRAMVYIEHITDWIHADPSSPSSPSSLSFSSVPHYCPTCRTLCALESNKYPTIPSKPLIASPQPTPNPKFEYSLTLAPRLLLQQCFAKILSLLPSSPHQSPPLLASPSTPSSVSIAQRQARPQRPSDSSYALFNTDDEAYPESEHSVVLASSRLSTDMSEVFIRVTSIAGLTLFLFVLLS